MLSFTKNIGVATKEYNYEKELESDVLFVNRYLTDENYSKHFSSNGDRWRVNFLKAMQNPINGEIKLNSTDFFLLPAFLFHMQKYFRIKEGDNGNYIPVSKEAFNVHSINLSGKNLNFKDSNQQTSTVCKVSSSPHCYSYLAQFIAKNPSITTLNLNNTQLTDKGAQKICDALEKNTKLLIITLDGNPNISKETKDKIHQLLERNIQICNPKNIVAYH